MQAKRLPLDHAWLLSQALQQHLPWLTHEPLAGIHTAFMWRKVVTVGESLSDDGNISGYCHRNHPLNAAYSENSFRNGQEPEGKLCSRMIALRKSAT